MILMIGVLVKHICAIYGVNTNYIGNLMRKYL